MTNSMIEISTGICHSASEVLGQLTPIRDALVKSADKLNIAVVGGGTHPVPAVARAPHLRQAALSRAVELYGYLSKQFTIFGQHVHIGLPRCRCRAADAAPHVALHPALHCAVGVQPVRAGAGHGV